MKKISKLICINVPITMCNLQCKYCYISQQNQFEGKMPQFKYSVEHMVKCLSQERLGGVCIVNLTGGGETLLPNEMTSIIKGLLENGHYLEVVTNGTISKRFDEIAELPYELLERLEFKFSFHFLELKRLNKIDLFFTNVNKMKKVGCSFTIEMMPDDEMMPYIDEVKALCFEKVGAICQLTVGRKDTCKDKKILTELNTSDYINVWKKFASTMFDFKLSIFGKKRKEFCYAGAWSLYINLENGDAKSCYGQLVNQNIFNNPRKPIKFLPVGYGCKQPFCYNGHAFLTLGVIPELETPTYADIRNRKCIDGEEWLRDTVKSAFSTKLYDTNIEYSKIEKVIFTIKTPIRVISDIITSIPAIRKKLSKKMRKKVHEERN